VRVTILDLGIGNLHSLEKALVRLVPESQVSIKTDPLAAADTDLLIFPGVGAFTDAAARLAPGKSHLQNALKNGLPCVGICLGMQLFFDESDEGPGEGLSVFEGKVTRLTTARVPHMGFSPIRISIGAPAWARPWAGQDTAMYYAHSFVCRPSDQTTIVAETELDGDRFPVIVQRYNTVGCQFHPEKSSAEGLELLGTIVRHVTGKGRA
jgi:glutamine amidotransferase